jgi:Flp pilus assembly protein TadG
MSRRRISLENEQGQTMVEFAIVLPVLALLLFGVIQFGIAFNNYLTLTDAVRAGARKAAVSREAASPCGAAVAEVQSSATDLDKGSLTVSCSSSWDPASDVTISAGYPYSIHLLGMVVMSGQLKSSTTERVE